MQKVIILIIGFMCIHYMSAQNAESAESGLDKKQLKIVTIAANTAVGNLQELKKELNGGLDAGLTVNEIKEVLVHLYAYCGFPRSLQGINTFIAVLEERKAKGIVDITGRKATPINDVSDKYERGKKMLESLTNTKETELKGANAFSPEIDVFLKEHLFADIFERDVLSYEQRELATISALSALGNVEPQLNGHKFIGRNVGLSENQIAELSQIVQDGQHKQMIDTRQMIFRIAEVEVYPQYLDEYVKEAKEVSEVSVNCESGVVCIYPVQVKRDKNQIRIVEVYADGQAYDKHIRSAHFQKYKQGTQHMVKSLDLVDMDALNPQMTSRQFSIPIIPEVDTDALNPQMTSEIFSKVQTEHASIYPKGNQLPNDCFSGAAWLFPLVNTVDTEGFYAIGQVTFAVGGRTFWHTHPAGQILLCTDGKGWYQERGKPAQALKKGDVVIIPKDVEHWHGAAADSPFVHIAVTNYRNGSGVTWHEAVTDEEYNSINQ
jgi:quercetin dioxygenase-like cupin family protein/alkylhydroperoxidase/carboxymuconolactone decarboxylase family protein YurZ/quinol monooxygenase YgiN